MPPLAGSGLIGNFKLTHYPVADKEGRDTPLRL